jgi:hypothetical protein
VLQNKEGEGGREGRKEGEKGKRDFPVLLVRFKSL